MPEFESPAPVLLTMVHYHDKPGVLAFVEHARAVGITAGVLIECAVADNSGTWEEQPGSPSWITLVRPGRNLGYLAGCAAAFDAWCQRHAGLPEWVAVVNTDLRFAPDFFGRLMSLELTEDIGVVAPDVRLRNGTRQNPHMRIRPTPLRIVLTMVICGNPVFGWLWHATYGLRCALKRRLRRQAPPVPTATEPELIYSPHGSAIFLRRQYFERGASLACRSFMFCEEWHVAERARGAGLRVAWVPELNIIHEANATTGTAGYRRRSRWMHQSTRVIWEDYYRGDRRPALPR